VSFHLVLSVVIIVEGFLLVAYVTSIANGRDKLVGLNSLDVSCALHRIVSIRLFSI